MVFEILNYEMFFKKYLNEWCKNDSIPKFVKVYLYFLDTIIWAQEHDVNIVYADVHKDVLTFKYWAGQQTMTD